MTAETAVQVSGGGLPVTCWSICHQCLQNATATKTACMNGCGPLNIVCQLNCINNYAATGLACMAALTACEALLIGNVIGQITQIAIQWCAANPVQCVEGVIIVIGGIALELTKDGWIVVVLV
jgi:hypothetical protein